MANGSPHRETARHRAAFEVWFEESRGTPKAAERLGICERVLHEWKNRFAWHARADARDAEAARIADREATKRRAAMLIRHRQAGELLVRRGMEHHGKHPIQRASDATAAITKGIDIERTAEGMPAYFEAIAKANENELAIMERAFVAAGEEAGAPPDPDAPRGTGGGAGSGAAGG